MNDEFVIDAFQVLAHASLCARYSTCLPHRHRLVGYPSTPDWITAGRLHECDAVERTAEHGVPTVGPPCIYYTTHTHWHPLFLPARNRITWTARTGWDRSHTGGRV